MFYQWHFLYVYIYRNLLLFANCSERRGGSGGDFVAGFLLGGAIFGTLAYVFAPQVRTRSLFFFPFSA